AAAAVGLSTMTYGFADGDVTISDYRATRGGATGHIEGHGLSLEVAIATAGRHMLANAVAALLAARAAGGDVEKSLAALASHGAPEGRGAAALLGDPGNPIRLIDESYNA
ncbi:MAG TPA: UDP-N-acetylmuramoylalanyl-D-glutamyl-2, 6-diaminopimelate--D-alanyl-D-alanine ligase, partial [Pelagibacterium sp.]|nr:UDP-N-acetylmuramoylalanyl-D-glutamyl-2, 6-diaminopimelate--D-alanyl-D-alanine ligase [Pelagibacterium sp.]